MSSRIPPASPDFSSRSHETPRYTAEQTQVIEAVDTALTTAQSITAQLMGRYATRLRTNRIFFPDESQTQAPSQFSEPPSKRRRVFTSEPMQSLSIRPSTPSPIAAPDYPSTPPTVALPPQSKHPFTYRPPEMLRNPFMRNNLRFIDRSGLFSIDWENQRINLTRPHEGRFFLVSEIAKNQLQLIQGLPNDRLIVKMFNRHNLLVNNAPMHKVNQNTVDAIITQYCELQKLNLAVATIYNTNEVMNGNCGYFLCEKIPNHFILPWTEGQAIHSLSPEAKNILDQLKHFFKLTYNHNVIIEDLRPDYFRLRKNQQLVLVDFQKFHSDSEDEADKNYRFNDMLEQFGCSWRDEIYNYLNPVPQ